MPTVTAVLATWKRNAKGQCPVYIRISDADGRKLKATGIRVTERQWNENEGRVRRGVAGSKQYNAKLANLIATAERAIAQVDLEGGIARREEVARALDKKTPRKRQEVPTILDEYKRFVDGKRARCRPSTIQVYEALRGHLEAWLSPKHRVTDITTGFLHDLGTYLIGEGLSNSTVNKLITRAKGFCAFLEERGLIDRTPRAERLPTAKNAAVYLTMEELLALMRIDLSGEQPGYRAARDLFISGAMTGQRFSDLRGMRWEHVDLDGGWWNLPVQKKPVTIRVPLADPVRKIIESRKARPTPLPRLSNQKCNVFIKAVCEKAGITEPITTQTLKGAERETVTRPKWELVSTHAARRTFVTLNLQNGTPVSALLGLTHDDVRVLRSYIGADDREREKHVTRLFGSL